MTRLVLSLVVLAGCGSSDAAPTTEDTGVAVADSATTDTATEGDSAAADDVAMIDSEAPEATTDVGMDADLFGPYPAGPYGNKVGDVVANLTWAGFRNPLADEISTKKPYADYDLDQLRRDAKKGYALVHVSEFF